MNQDKNRGKTYQTRSILTAENSLAAFLMEKQAVSNFNFEATIDKKVSQNCYKTRAQEKSQGSKRRGRLQEKKWTTSETSKLYELHDQLGNKWKEIANFFPDRSDNNVKNHFFSRLRLSLRQLNKLVSKFIGPKKQIKNHTLYKITSVCQLKFKESSIENQSLIEEAISLKKKILSFSQRQHQNVATIDLWESISAFSGKTSQNKVKLQLSDEIQNQEISTHLNNNREIEFLEHNKVEPLQTIQITTKDKNTLRNINEDDFVLTRNLTPNERLLLSVPPQIQAEKTEQYVEKPAILVPENLFLSPTHSFSDSVFNLNISDQSYFSLNQNISFYTDFLIEHRPQYGGQNYTL